jgi:nitroreductase
MVVTILRGALARLQGDTPPETAVDADALFAAIAHRRSMGLSRLKPDPVDRGLIERMLEAANWAPSHGDTEPWKFTVFAGEGREVLAELFTKAYREGKAADPNAQDHDGPRKRAFAAPVWISIGVSPQLGEDGLPRMSEQEEAMAVACAVQNLHLMASALGLAGMWHSKGLSVDPIVAQGLGLEPPARLLGFFMCGHPACDWFVGERRPLAEKVTWVEGRGE